MKVTPVRADRECPVVDTDRNPSYQTPDYPRLFRLRALARVALPAGSAMSDHRGDRGGSSHRQHDEHNGEGVISGEQFGPVCGERADEKRRSDHEMNRDVADGAVGEESLHESARVHGALPVPCQVNRTLYSFAAWSRNRGITG